METHYCRLTILFSWNIFHHLKFSELRFYVLVRHFRSRFDEAAEIVYLTHSWLGWFALVYA